MMLQPLSILRKWDSVSLKKAVRTFFPSNCNFSGNIEPIIFCFSLKSQSVSLSGRLVIKLIPFFSQVWLSVFCAFSSRNSTWYFKRSFCILINNQPTLSKVFSKINFTIVDYLAFPSFKCIWNHV